jgi:hypothetical protein
MANREMTRVTTRAYATEEGVSVTEEHFRFPLRSETLERPLEPKEICEFDMVTFEKTDRQSVFWVRESQGNACSDKRLEQCVHAAITAELDSDTRLAPEGISVFVEKQDQRVEEFPYFRPPFGNGRLDCDDPRNASKDEITTACRSNLGCKENLVAQHTHKQDLSNETMFKPAAAEAKVSDAQLWRKLQGLNQEAAEEQPQTVEAVQEQTKKR